MIYLLDSNIFITAARTYYSFDFGNAFWNFLLDKANNNLIKSIDKVYDEIVKQKDELSDWAKNQFSKNFLSTQNTNVINNYRIIVNWAEKQQQYSRIAKNEFMKEKNADPWLVAYAMQDIEQFKIVTFERGDRNIKRKIPIPNVCNDFKVKFCDLFTMMKDLNFKFK